MTDQLKTMWESVKKHQEERRTLFSLKAWSTAQERRWHKLETELRKLMERIELEKP